MGSSWQGVSDWYDKIVSKEGHYYHRELILPNLLQLLQLKKGDAVLDLACGQGVLARQLPKGVDYTGVDGAKGLIDAAKGYSEAQFVHHDLTKPLALGRTFSHVVIVLAFQNISEPMQVLKTARSHLRKNGDLILVLNHPCFRIPRQSSWQVDESKKIQYRRIDRYGSPLQIPIYTSPSQKEDSQVTWSYHYSLSQISEMLSRENFGVDRLYEWYSNKQSSGKAAKMENFARKEFPLFLTVRAKVCAGSLDTSDQGRRLT